MSFEERIAELNRMIAGARRIVFFTGAGISTGSGIPDFRSDNGLYITSLEDSPEYMLSATCLAAEPERFFEYLRNNMDFRGYYPNIAHRKISELQLARTVSVVTQNIDGLHEKAGSKVVDAIHGTMDKFYCPGCGSDIFHPEDVMDGNYDNSDGVPKCILCGGDSVIRPDITLYGEGLPITPWTLALQHIRQADLLIVVGTSLQVAPANMLVSYFGNDNKTVIINRDETPFDDCCALRFHEDICDVFSRIEVPEA